VLQQKNTKKSLLLSERLHLLLKTLKIHNLDYSREQQINILSSWEQWCFSRSKCRGAFGFHPTNWCEGLHKATILHLMGSSTTRKSSNEHEFFVDVTSLNKIGEGRIWDLTGDVLFPVTFKYAMLIVIRKIRDITGASCLIISWCVLRTARIFLALGQKFWLLKCSPIEQADRFKYPPIDAVKTLEPVPSIWPRLLRNKKPKVKILQRQKQKARITNTELKSWTSDANLADTEIENMDPNASWY